MKRLWIVLGIVAGILILSTLALFDLIESSESMDAELEEIAQAVETRDTERLPPLIERFQESWERKEGLMVLYIHNDELDSITGGVARLPALARYEDYPELAAEVSRLRHLIRHIRESETPTLTNIF